MRHQGSATRGTSGCAMTSRPVRWCGRGVGDGGLRRGPDDAKGMIAGPFCDGKGIIESSIPVYYYVSKFHGFILKETTDIWSGENPE
jgi:hypothetical protein